VGFEQQRSGRNAAISRTVLRSESGHGCDGRSVRTGVDTLGIETSIIVPEHSLAARITSRTLDHPPTRCVPQNTKPVPTRDLLTMY